MAIMITEVYDALRDVGVSEDKAKRAAEAVASHEDRLRDIETKLARLTGITSVIGVAVVAILISQGLLWQTLGRQGAQLDQMGGQLTHIEQMLSSR